MNAILATTYFGPLQWYQKLNRFDGVLMEQHEHFLKQTYRNRCVIATTQGVQALTVPVEAPVGEGLALSKTPIKDARISNHGKWRTEHWNALQSAYGESPFFEFYEDDIRPFFENRWEFLLDFNMAITEKMCELLDIHPSLLGRVGEGPTSAPSSTPSILRRTATSVLSPTTRYIKKGSAFCQTFPFLTFFSIWVTKPCSIFSGYRTA